MASLSRPPLAEYVLVALFGSSAWLGVNAVWMSMPLLVDRLPETWKLPSYLSLIVQLACIAPIAYGLTRRFSNRVQRANHVR